MKQLLAAVLCLFACVLPLVAAEPIGSSSAPTNGQPTLIVVAGSPGAPEYDTNFTRQVELWTSIAARATAQTSVIGLGQPAGRDDRDQLKDLLTASTNDLTQPLWLVFIGHGTFDGKEARFNLRGPDVTASDLAQWLGPVKRPLVFINTTSASAPFLNKLSATNRVIITATRSGNEQNFARFGQFFAAALSDPESDLDQDGQISVLEAFLTAGARVRDFYKTEGRLATEHALIDDNGDGLGTSPDWFRGVRAVKKPEGGRSVDGVRAHQFHLVLSATERQLPADVRARRDAIELEVARLRDSKATRPEAEYYHELEKLLAQLIEAYGPELR